MATLASRTKELSGLAYGSLAQHLSAIELGTGERLVSMMTVCVSKPRTTVTQRAVKREAPAQRAQLAAPQARKQGRDVSVLTVPNRLELTRTPSDIYVVSALYNESFVHHKVATMEITR